MKNWRIAYIFPMVIFCYGLIAVLLQKIWLRDPGGSAIVVEGTAAVLLGISSMLLGYLIFSVVRYVACHKDPHLDPFTFKNKILLIIFFILSMVGGMWDIF
jgi:hypothetical protein